MSGSSPITSSSTASKAHQKSGSFAPPALPGLNALTTLSDFRSAHQATLMLKARAPSRTDLPRLPGSPFQRAVPTTPVDRDGCKCRLLPHPTRPSPLFRRVGIHDFTFEACSGFTRVTARRIAQPPKAAVVARLRSAGHPDKSLASYQINRQLSGWNLPPLVNRAVGAH